VDLKECIRDVPDFPKQGIIFKDITTLLKNPEALRCAVDLLAERYKDQKIDQVVAIESRGFIFGSPLAYHIGAGFIPVRKPGKLPSITERVSYELEYGTDSLEIHRDAVEPGQKVLIIDDLLATGGTAVAVAQLIEKLQAKVAGFGFVIELTFLKGRDRVKNYEVHSLLQY
jgi:adenine phosphoribosyltransferase